MLINLNLPFIYVDRLGVHIKKNMLQATIEHRTNTPQNHNSTITITYKHYVYYYINTNEM